MSLLKTCTAPQAEPLSLDSPQISLTSQEEANPNTCISPGAAGSGERRKRARPKALAPCPAPPPAARCGAVRAGAPGAASSSSVPAAVSPRGRAAPPGGRCPLATSPRPCRPPHRVPRSSAARASPSSSRKRGALRRPPPPCRVPGAGRAAPCPHRPPAPAAPPAPCLSQPGQQQPRQPETAP